MSLPREPLAPAVAELLATAIDTFEKLEIVLHLHRAGDLLGTQDLVTAIAAPREVVSIALKQLASVDVIVAERAGWALASSGVRAAQLSALVAAVAVDRTQIFRFLTARSVERIRADAARAFADAFVLRPKKRSGGDR